MCEFERFARTFLYVLTGKLKLPAEPGPVRVVPDLVDGGRVELKVGIES